MHTTAYWLTLEKALVESLPYSISERQSGMFGLLHAMESVATLLLMCDGRDLGTAIGERPPAPGAESEAFLPVSMEEAMHGTAKEILRAEFIFVRCVSGWRWIFGAAVSRARTASRKNS